MSKNSPSHHSENKNASDSKGLALAVAVSGLEEIRSEGPVAEPAYPTNGSPEARESWAFDSASYDRAQLAQAALDRVAEIMDDKPGA